MHTHHPDSYSTRSNGICNRWAWQSHPHLDCGIPAKGRSSSRSTQISCILRCSEGRLRPACRSSTHRDNFSANDPYPHVLRQEPRVPRRQAIAKLRQTSLRSSEMYNSTVSRATPHEHWVGSVFLPSVAQVSLDAFLAAAFPRPLPRQVGR